MQYKRITIITTTQFSDIIANALFEYNSTGVSIVDHNDVLSALNSPKNWDYYDPTLSQNTDSRVFVTGYFDVMTDIEPLLSEISAFKDNPDFETGSLEVSVSAEDSADYENVWKQYYKPIPCGKITIVPKWIPFEQKDSVPVFIDPGCAFGTGNHETTAMCAELIQDIPLQDRTIADIGCGSGILGICALKLGADKCYFIDIDEDAVKASKENAAYNGVSASAVFMKGDLSGGLSESVDAVLANLTASLLVRLYGQASAILKKGGYMLVSGILDAYADEVLAQYTQDFSVIKTEKRNGWQAMVFKKL